MQSHFAKALVLAAIAAVAAPSAQAQLLPISVELGDVSLTKLPFVMAAEAGIYRRNGLDVKQYITPRAAELIRHSSGVVVPKEFVGTGARRHQHRRRQPDHRAHDLRRARAAARRARHQRSGVALPHHEPSRHHSTRGPQGQAHRLLERRARSATTC